MSREQNHKNFLAVAKAFKLKIFGQKDFPYVQFPADGGSVGHHVPHLYCDVEQGTLEVQMTTEDGDDINGAFGYNFADFTKSWRSCAAKFEYPAAGVQKFAQAFFVKSNVQARLDKIPAKVITAQVHARLERAAAPAKATKFSHSDVRRSSRAYAKQVLTDLYAVLKTDLPEVYGKSPASILQNDADSLAVVTKAAIKADRDDIAQMARRAYGLLVACEYITPF